MKIEGGKHSESGEKPAKHYRFIKASGLQNGFSAFYLSYFSFLWASLVAQLVKNPPGSIPGLGISPGEVDGYPLQYSGMENSMDYSIGSQRVRHD